MSQQTNTAFILPQTGAGLHTIIKRTTDIPSPKAHEVLVKIHAFSVNYRDFAMSAAFYPVPRPPNQVLGSDMAGEVIEAGEGVVEGEFKKGDRVTANFNQAHFFGTHTGPRQDLGDAVEGVFQEYHVFNVAGLLHVPKHLTYEEAACGPCAGVTAWNALYGGISLAPGQTVLFQGTGGVSLAGLQFAAAAGAKTIVTSSSDEKLAIAKKLGATHTINYKTNPDWDKVVLELTEGVGAHHILDNVGVEEIGRCFNCAATGGNIHCIGFLGDMTKPAPNVLLSVLMKSLSIRGIYVGSKQLHSDMLRFMDTNKLRPHIDRVFAFEDTVKALEYLGSGKHVGKVVVKVSA